MSNPYYKFSCICDGDKHMVTVSDYPMKLGYGCKAGEEWAWELMSVLDATEGVTRDNGVLIGAFTTTYPDWAQGKEPTMEDALAQAAVAHRHVCGNEFGLANMGEGEFA